MTANLHSETDRLIDAGAATRRIRVKLAKDLVPLLSQQLYQSPIKAVEELVVNAFDAEAKECWVSVRPEQAVPFVTVTDDGMGMDLEGLQSLWTVGRSLKRRDEEYQRRVKRTQIGKFGIGKLAASALAHTVTYISRVEGIVRAITLDFRDFDEQEEDFELPVSEGVVGDTAFDEIVAKAALYGDLEEAWFRSHEHWTHCVLTNLKDKASALSIGKLQWVLSTAMPITDDFALHLHLNRVTSSKAKIPLVQFTVADLESERLDRIGAESGETFSVNGDQLVSPMFPSGISFAAAVYADSLNTGKSADLGRSYGFFVRVRNRLVNERDPNFGMSPRAFRTWNRFRATINADDLDDLLTAPREGVGDAKKREVVQIVAREIFNACRARHDQIIAEWQRTEKKAKEIGRNPVSPRLVEHPLADVLLRYGPSAPGADADNSWFYLTLPGEQEADLIQSLYAPRKGLYSYRFEDLGENGRLVQYHPDELTFVINERHELTREYGDDFQSRRLLEDLVTAEAMLEVYLRDAGVPVSAIASVLQERDNLLRSLAKNQSFSLRNIADELRAAKGSDNDLEVALVASMRAFGFIAKHVSGAGKPDGVARYFVGPGDERKYTLEAKSTNGASPSLAAIDFAGLVEHRRNEDALGCILIAPAYPGAAEDSAAARRAVDGRISCWTIDDLANVVEAAEDRQITAAQMAQIIESNFSPADVASAVQKLLAEPNADFDGIERDILDQIEVVMPMSIGAPLDISYIHARLGMVRADIRRETVEIAVENIARKSDGLLRLRGVEVSLFGGVAEIRRRAGIGLAGGQLPRRTGDFKGSGKDEA